MARFDTSGIDSIISQMESMGAQVSEVAEDMVQAACEEIKQAWREKIEARGLVDTGAMRDSVGYKRQPTKLPDVVYNEVTPQGKDAKGVRNAEKAFILHYGKHNMQATYWADAAEKKADSRVEQKLTEIFEKFIEGGN